MNQHLSSEQISNFLIGDASVAELRHVEECASCEAEVASLSRSLSVFRSSVRNWSAQTENPAWRTALNFSSGLGSSRLSCEGDPDVHLTRLLTPEVPWYREFFHNIKEAIHPRELPPLELTSKPVDIKELHIYAGNEKKAGLSSLLIHAAAIALLFILGSLKPVQNLIKQEFTPLADPNLAPYKPDKEAMHGGGGGGDHSILKASKGKLPKFAPKQFTPPKVDPPEHPKLPIEATIVAPPDAPIPNIEAPNYGDPLSHLGIPMNGTGVGGGIGAGGGGGVGSGRGAGVGPGSGGGFGGGAYHIGGGVSQPSVISKVEPEYSEEARKAKWQGQVILQLVVDEHGHAQNVKVLRALGLGLDQKAIEAVEKWVFKPGMKDGKPVPVYATIQIDFRLL